MGKKFNTVLMGLIAASILPQVVYKKKRETSRVVAPRFDILSENKTSFNQTEYRLKATNGFPLFVKSYDVDSPKAVVQIVHGALEHHARYKSLIKYLNCNGYAVIANDHRGHGRSVNENYPKGHMNGADELLDDLILVSDFAKALYPELPLYMFGHSMGSMLARAYLYRYDTQIDKLVLSGTPPYNPLVPIGIAAARVINFYQGEKKINSLLNVLPDGTEWLSSNEAHHEMILDDPLKVEAFDNAGNLTIFEINQRLNYPPTFKADNPYLPILNIVGTDDIIIKGEAGVQASLEKLTHAGYHYIQNIMYPGLKHELIHEESNDDVMADVLAFFESKV